MSSTLLQKAQQALNEKLTKVIPENIKQGVTMFGVTGTHSGSSGTKALYYGRKGHFIPANLAAILGGKLTDEEKALELQKDGDPLLPALTITAGYAYNNGQTDIMNLGFPINIAFKHLQNGLELNRLHYNSGFQYETIAQLDDGQSTSQYYKQTMTVSDLITLLDNMQPIDFECTYSTELYMHDIVSIGLNLAEDYNSNERYIIERVTNNFLTFEPVEYTWETDAGDVIHLEPVSLGYTLQRLITNAGRGFTLKHSDCGNYNPCIILGKMSIYNSDIWEELDLGIQIDNTDSALRLVAGKDGVQYNGLFANDIIVEEESETEWPTSAFTLGWLIDTLCATTTNFTQAPIYDTKIYLPFNKITIRYVLEDIDYYGDFPHIIQEN